MKPVMYPTPVQQQQNEHQGGGPLSMPAPIYDGATQEALNLDVEALLDNDQILADANAANMDNSDVLAQQQLALARAQTEQYAQQFNGLQAQNATLQNQVGTLQGNLEQLTAQQQAHQNQQAQAAQQQAEEAAFNQQLASLQPTAEELEVHGDAMPVFEKLVQAALMRQERQLTQRFNETLAQQTAAAVQPLNQQLEQTQTQLANQQSALEADFETQLANHMAPTGTTFEDLLRTPEFTHYASQRIPGTTITPLDALRAAVKERKTSQVMEIVNGYMNTQGFDTTANASVPSASGGARVVTNEHQTILAKRTQLQEQLAEMEQANAQGDYSKFGNNRKKFMETRNKLLNALQKLQLPK